MDRREKQYILQNAGKKTLREIASELGIKERKVKKFLHENRLKGGHRITVRSPVNNQWQGKGNQ